MIFLEGTSNSFLGVRPEWTLAGAKLTGDPGEEIAVDQGPFHWAHGVWEADVIARGKGAVNGTCHRVLMRIAPETVRRWKEADINPFLEACAQLREHLGRKRQAGGLSLLILL